MGDIDRDEEFPISVRLAMCPAERERDPSGCRASGRPITPELPVLAVLVLPLPRLQALVPGGECNVNRIAISISWIALGSFVFASCSGYEKLWVLYLLVPATALSGRIVPSFSAAPEAYRREGKSGEYLAMKLNNTHFNSSRHN